MSTEDIHSYLMMCTSAVGTVLTASTLGGQIHDQASWMFVATFVALVTLISVIVARNTRVAPFLTAATAAVGVGVSETCFYEDPTPMLILSISMMFLPLVAA